LNEIISPSLFFNEGTNIEEISTKKSAKKIKINFLIKDDLLRIIHINIKITKVNNAIFDATNIIEIKSIPASILQINLKILLANEGGCNKKQEANSAKIE